MPLTDAYLRKAKGAPKRFKKADGGGLFILIQPDGKKLWRLSYTPKTNGKAERFIQTALREWTYARAYQTSDQRTDDLPMWTHMYNWHRPHGGINDQTPISRLGLNRDNPLRFHS
jgi:hypothetical protein